MKAMKRPVTLSEFRIIFPRGLVTCERFGHRDTVNGNTSQQFDAFCPGGGGGGGGDGHYPLLPDPGVHQSVI